MIKITWQNETYVIHQWKFFLNLLKISFCMLEITWKKETFEIIIKNDVSSLSKLKSTDDFLLNMLAYQLQL